MNTAILPSESLEKVADILKSIAHPIRLEVLAVLQKEEPLSVNQIGELIRIPVEQSLLSHHLNKMKDRGILLNEKRGKYIHYRIADRHVLKIFDCMANCDLI